VSSGEVSGHAALAPPVTPASTRSRTRGNRGRRGKSPIVDTPTASAGRRFILGAGAPKDEELKGTAASLGGMGGIRGVHPADRASIRSKLRSTFRGRKDLIKLQFRR